MEFDALLEQRRSIRRYQAQPVGKEQIEQMIEAARRRPGKIRRPDGIMSSCRSRCWIS